jgi:hypothetical protein
VSNGEREGREAQEDKGQAYKKGRCKLSASFDRVGGARRAARVLHAAHNAAHASTCTDAPPARPLARPQARWRTLARPSPRSRGSTTFTSAAARRCRRWATTRGRWPTWAPPRSCRPTPRPPPTRWATAPRSGSGCGTTGGPRRTPGCVGTQRIFFLCVPPQLPLPSRRQVARSGLRLHAVRADRTNTYIAACALCCCLCRRPWHEPPARCPSSRCWPPAR